MLRKPKQAFQPRPKPRLFLPKPFGRRSPWALHAPLTSPPSAGPRQEELLRAPPRRPRLLRAPQPLGGRRGGPRGGRRPHSYSESTAPQAPAAAGSAWPSSGPARPWRWCSKGQGTLSRGSAGGRWRFMWALRPLILSNTLEGGERDSWRPSPSAERPGSGAAGGKAAAEPLALPAGKRLLVARAAGRVGRLAGTAGTGGHLPTAPLLRQQALPLPRAAGGLRTGRPSLASPSRQEHGRGAAN